MIQFYKKRRSLQTIFLGGLAYLQFAKLGYLFLQNSSQTQQPSPSTVDSLKPLWNKIWALNVLAKVKNLI